MGNDARKLSFGAVFAALVVLGTMYLRIPGVTGYYHLGDGFIYAAALLLGPAWGAVAAGVGSGLADILGGWAVWAPWSLVIKGLTALVVGLLGSRTGSTGRNVLAMLAGGAVTIVGYAAATYILYGGAAVPAEVYGNIGQVATGVVVGLVVLAAGKHVV